MNFLAHLALSNSDHDLMIGNFIADSLKSSEWENFEQGVIEGIKLHHKIDFFTDHHAIVEQSKKRLRPTQGKYSPVVADILYDHFLARHFENYYLKSLPDFAEGCYRLFHQRWDELPAAVQRMIPYMEDGNWLVNYGNREGLMRVFSGMSRRASFDNSMQKAVEDMEEHYEKYEEEFLNYFPLLRDYVNREIEKMPW